MGAVDLGVNLFVALFALVDPIGNIPIFAAATAGASTPLGAHAAALYTEFVDGGNSGLDYSAIIKLIADREA